MCFINLIIRASETVEPDKLNLFQKYTQMKKINKHYQEFFPTKNNRKAMVSWFSPFILLKTLKDLVLSKIVGSQVDTRELQSVNESTQDSYTAQVQCKVNTPYTQVDDQGDFYFDYIADTGDGWESTYSIASLLSRDYLCVNTKQDKLKLPRGSFLLLGGDEIYPGPSEINYENRLLNPFHHAWDWLWLNDTNTAQDNNIKRQTGTYLPLERTPDIYAIPGNHDWYDSLIAFRKIFCNVFEKKRIGQWKTNQSRSYFAISLPHDWVILAFDFGLDQYKLDGLQHHYFNNIIEKLTAQNKLIIMAAEPQWVFGGVQNAKLNQAYQDIENLIYESFAAKGQQAAKIYLNLSGDTHNYQRYESLSGSKLESSMKQCAKKFKCTTEQMRKMQQSIKSQHARQQIVAGGGGAFLHPTHSTTQKNMRIIPNHAFSLGDYAHETKVSEVEVKDQFELKSCYPDVKTSKRLAVKLLLRFIPNNIKLGFFIATIYLVLAWPMRAFLDSVIIQKQFNGFADSGLNFLTLLISALLILGFTLWARSRPSFGLTLAGLIHGVFQALLLYGGYVLVYFLMASIWQSYELQYGWFLFPIARDTLYFLIISIASPALLALALWVYLTYFQANQNDLFGSGSIAQYKNLLRFKIDKNGALTIYPIALKNVVNYSLPTEDETSQQHLKVLRQHNGKNWNNEPSCAPVGQKQLEPQKLVYHLIEEPIIIQPINDY